eukprot:SAG31_NODE_361_length_16995_cov_9.316229_2_plen_1307_part_00
MELAADLYQVKAGSEPVPSPGAGTASYVKQTAKAIVFNSSNYTLGYTLSWAQRSWLAYEEVCPSEDSQCTTEETLLLYDAALAACGATDPYSGFIYQETGSTLNTNSTCDSTCLPTWSSYWYCANNNPGNRICDYPANLQQQFTAFNALCEAAKAAHCPRDVARGTVGGSVRPTPGVFVGAATLIGFDFSVSPPANHEDMIITVDGSAPQVFNLQADMSTPDLAVAALNALNMGATASLDATTGAVVLTSDTAGTGSAVEVDVASSGANVRAIFGGGGVASPGAPPVSTVALAEPVPGIEKGQIVTGTGIAETVTVAAFSGSCAGSDDGTGTTALTSAPAVVSPVIALTGAITTVAPGQIVSGTGILDTATVLSTAGICTGSNDGTNDGTPVPCAPNVATAGTLVGSSFTPFDFASATAGTFTGDSIAPHDFSTPASPGTLAGNGFVGADFSGAGLGTQPLVLTVDGSGAPITVSLTAAMSSAGDVVAALNADGAFAAAAVASVDGSEVKITSRTTGPLSAVAIETGSSGANAQALFGSSPAVATGASAAAEDLAVTIDGVPITVSLDVNVMSAADAVAALNADATFAAAATASVEGGNIKITSASTGPSSMVVMETSTTGSNALDLFGSSPSTINGVASPNEMLRVVVDGQSAQSIALGINVQSPADLVDALNPSSGTYTGTFVPYDFSPATSGTYAGTGFTPFDFTGVNSKNLIVEVDNSGVLQSVLITGNCNTASSCVAFISVVGAVVTESAGMLVVTSATTGTNSAVRIDGTSDDEALLLFYISVPGAPIGGVSTGGEADRTEQLVVEIDNSGDLLSIPLTSHLASFTDAVGALTRPGSPLAPTAGTATGSSFAGYDFANDGPEQLVIVVDGGRLQLLTLSTDLTTATAAAAALTTGIDGATASVTGANVIAIRSDSTGSSSSVLIEATGSGSNALALVDSPIYVAGTGPPAVVSAVSGSVVLTSATSGTSSAVRVDGSSGPNAQRIFVNPIQTDGQAGALSGALASVDGLNVRLTSLSVGAASSVGLGDSSGNNALRLFGADQSDLSSLVTASGIDGNSKCAVQGGNCIFAANTVTLSSSTSIGSGTTLTFTTPVTTATVDGAVGGTSVSIASPNDNIVTGLVVSGVGISETVTVAAIRGTCTGSDDGLGAACANSAANDACAILAEGNNCVFSTTNFELSIAQTIADLVTLTFSAMVPTPCATSAGQDTCEVTGGNCVFGTSEIVLSRGQTLADRVELTFKMPVATAVVNAAVDSSSLVTLQSGNAAIRTGMAISGPGLPSTPPVRIVATTGKIFAIAHE